MKLKRLSLFLALVMILSAFAGTFTFASAATTAGGTFEIWRDGAKASEYTGKITAAIADTSIEAGDTVKLTSDYHLVAREDLTVALTIDGQSQYKIYTTVADGTNRLFNTTADLTFQNIELETVQSCVQANTNALTLTFTNVHFSFSAAKASAAQIVLTVSGQTANIKNCVARQTGASVFVWAANNPNQTVVIDGLDYKSEGICMASGNTGVVAQVSKASSLTIKNSKIDASETTGQRLIYCDNGSTPTITIDNSAIFGSDGTYDVGQIGVTGTAADYIASGKLSFGNNVLFVGAGSGTSAEGNIFRIRGDGNADDTTTYSYNDATDPYNNIQVRNLKDTTVDALLASYGVNKVALNNGNYDEVAQSMGYATRVTSAEEAYANGKMTGYFFDVGYAARNLKVSDGGSKINSVLYVLNDCGIASTTTVALANAESTLTYEGIAKADGSYPTLSVGTGMFTFTYGVNLGTTTIKNLNIVATGNMVAQINTGLLVFDNCTINQKTTTYGFVIQGKDANAANTSANETAGEILYYGQVKLKDSTYIATTNMHVFRYNSTYGAAYVENSTIIHKGTNSPVYVMSDGMLTVDANSTFVIDGKTPFTFGSGKTLTLNGVAVTSPITAGAMLDGASVRIAKGATAENLTESGIRFESALTAAQITAAEATGATVSYGTVVFKKADLGNKTVAELVEAANADANDALIVADIEAKDGIVTDAEGNKTIRAAIINIKEKNYGVEFGAVAYIELTYADGATVRIYGTFDATKNVRSIKGVAEAALEDYKTEAGVVDGYNYYNEITVEIEGQETTVYSCYSDEQIAILNTYAGK